MDVCQKYEITRSTFSGADDCICNSISVYSGWGNVKSGDHFWMRLAVGYAVNGICHNQVDYNKWWFREKPFEKRLYKWLKVKKWKDKMPSFTPETWDPRTHTWEEIAGAMCQSEVVHSIIVILSFVPIAATFIWGDFWVFFITSVLSAGVDSMFVIMQRYNRPRVLRLIKRRHD